MANLTEIDICGRIETESMAANTGNVDVVLDVDGKIVPSCPHGPTLLFQKYTLLNAKDGGVEKRFFSCSAFRDKKQCSFFQYEGDKITSEKILAREEANKQQSPPFSHKEYRQRFLKVKKLKEKDRSLCEMCGLLLLPGEQTAHKGQGHKIKSPITTALLSRPTELFRPLDNNKTYAQYLFSKSTVDFVLESLKKLSVTHVLCVGCPRIHEAIQVSQENGSDVKNNLQSILLDLDHRYYQLYSQKHFCRYNMFNHHFFDGEGARKCYTEFIREGAGKRVAMVIDPPFGGMVEVLLHTVSRIQAEWSPLSQGSEHPFGQLAVLWFFPYFMEKRIVEGSGYTMLDYKVDYDNHQLFTGGEKGRKKGSPVRIFTNIPPGNIPLPGTEGYWFCKKCDRHSAAENKHCDKCEDCTTKDGKTYKHCHLCNRCVKPSRVHCPSCNICDLPQHICGQNKARGCHICGELGHKRRECRQTTAGKISTHDSSSRGKKRKQKQSGNEVRRKKNKK